MKKQQGFTLIEILVSMAIIGILSTVVVGFVFEATSKSRDVRRKENIDQIAKAINFYYSDTGHLPGNLTGWCTFISNPSGGYGATFQSALEPYMKNIQFDPTKAGMVGDYLFRNVSNTNGQYVLCANMENPTGQSYDYSSCLNGTVYNYCVTQ